MKCIWEAKSANRVHCDGVRLDVRLRVRVEVSAPAVYGGPHQLDALRELAGQRLRPVHGAVQVRREEGAADRGVHPHKEAVPPEQARPFLQSVLHEVNYPELSLPTTNPQRASS